MNSTQRNHPLKDTEPDVIARLSIGGEACDDNIGSICVANRGNGFAVFINGGALPEGERERFFPASDIRCLANAFAFALSIAQLRIDEEVQIDGMIAAEQAGTRADSTDLAPAPKFPQVHVRLSGEDGNVFSIIGRVCRALRGGGASEADIESFSQQVMMAGDYDEALRTVGQWVQAS
jgi:hypothetical protein